MNRHYLILALFQLTGKGKVFSMNEIKEMNNKQLEEQWEYWVEPKTSNSRRKLIEEELSGINPQSVIEYENIDTLIEDKERKDKS